MPSDLFTWVKDQFDSESTAFDRTYGTATRWFDLNNYEPSPPSVVEQILDALGDPEGVRFVDLGSGKGRVVLLAARRPFVEAVGIELREGLHRRAERNLAAFASRVELACPVRLECVDALDWEVPPGPLVLFAYNPFPAVVLALVLRRTAEGTRLVYLNPRQHTTVLACGFVEIDRHEHTSVDRDWRLYRKSR